MQADYFYEEFTSILKILSRRSYKFSQSAWTFNIGGRNEVAHGLFKQTEVARVPGQMCRVVHYTAPDVYNAGLYTIGYTTACALRPTRIAV